MGRTPTDATALPYHAWHRAMLAVADTLYAGEEAPAPGMIGHLHAILDAMRAARAAPADIAQATRIALAAHRVGDAVRREGRASGTAFALRRDIRRDTLAWLGDVPLAAFA